MAKTIEQIVEEVKEKYKPREYNHSTYEEGSRGVLEVVPSEGASAVAFKNARIVYWNSGLMDVHDYKIYNGSREMFAFGSKCGSETLYSPKIISLREKDPTTNEYVLELQNCDGKRFFVEVNMGVNREAN